jgi:ABC-type sugar transport system permease subunit
MLHKFLNVYLHVCLFLRVQFVDKHMTQNYTVKNTGPTQARQSLQYWAIPLTFDSQFN